jgi:CRISPR-associated protein Csb2
MRSAFPKRAAEIERVFIGRKANGADDGSVAERMRIIPLPSIGHEYADHGIRRVLVEVPAECPFPAADVHWALSGLSIVDRETGEVMAVLMESQNDLMRRHYGLDDDSSWWRTVTPAALPGWIWRGIGRMRKLDEQKNAAARAVRERATGAVIKTMRFSNVRARVESVRVQREPFDVRGELAQEFEVGERFDKARLWHVEVNFESPVSGPLVIGDGRFMGLGVMAPAREKDTV